jgi:hypothetical protein
VLLVAGPTPRVLFLIGASSELNEDRLLLLLSSLRMAETGTHNSANSPSAMVCWKMMRTEAWLGVASRSSTRSKTKEGWFEREEKTLRKVKANTQCVQRQQVSAVQSGASWLVKGDGASFRERARAR